MPNGRNRGRDTRRAAVGGGWQAVLVLIGWWLVVPPLAAQTAAGCEGERHRALDFLLGEWRLVSGGEQVGTSRVEKLEDGCLIAESWLFDDGRSGQTYGAFDAAAGAWRRFSVSNRGVVIRSSGTVEEGVLLARGERATASGEATNWRERLAAEPDGRVRWVAGLPVADAATERGGRNDRGGLERNDLFDGHYVPFRAPFGKRDEPPLVPDQPPLPGSPPAEATPQPITVSTDPSPPPEPPRPEPLPTTGEVTPDSGRADDAASIERIAMASPMVLKLPLGAVESLPEGYAWITRDTAPYLCEGVTIQRIEVARKRRRGQVELQVELALHGAVVNRRVAVEIGLFPPGPADQAEAVATGSATGRVGRGIPEQVEHGSVALRVSLPMTAAAFDAVVAGAERPLLTITLTVGG